ncbi:MAG: DMT family transporter [Actinomycetes bacterium]
MSVKPRLSAKLAPWIFVFLWSSGFVAAKYVHPYSGPFTFLAIRYVLACVILAVVAYFQRGTWTLTRTQVWHSALVAVFLHVIYIGGVFFAIHEGVTSGISAVIVSLQPVFVALLAIPMLGERFKPIEALGLFLGIVGVALLLLPKLFQGNFSSQFTTAGIVSCIVALFGTTIGYILQKKTGGGIAFVPGTAVQYGVSSLIFIVLSLTMEDNSVQWTPQFVAGLAWIVLMMSIGSIFLLYSLLRQGSAGSVSSLYYLVPPCAALQAYFLFGERISALGLVGMALAGLGVMLVMRATDSAGH